MTDTDGVQAVNQSASDKEDDGLPRRRSQRGSDHDVGDDLDLGGSPSFNQDGDALDNLLGSGRQGKPLLQAQDGDPTASEIERQIKQQRDRKMIKARYSQEGVWLSFNKYLYTIVLLFMATFHLNLLGFLFFALFILHTFAYYSFRTTDTPFDHLLNVPRAGKVDLRPFFCYCNVTVSSIALVAIMVMKIMLHMSGQDDNAFDSETETAKGKDGTDSFSLMTKLIPDFDSLYTLASTILAFLFSIVMLFTRALEKVENANSDADAKTIAKSFAFSNQHGQQSIAESHLAGEQMVDADQSSRRSQPEDSVLNRKSALKRVSNTIQDYHFKHNTLSGISFVLLGVIAASALTWVNLPYQVLFVFHAFCLGFDFSSRVLTLQRVMSWLLLAMLFVELLTQYALYIRSFSQTFTAREKYQREVQGLLLNTTSFIVFGFKTLLLIIECSRIQFLRHLSQLEFITEAQNLVQSVCNKGFSFFAKLMTPVSQFLFCMIAIIFALLHPSIIFVPLIPVTILAFFSDVQASCSVFSFTKRLFLLLAMVFTCALYLYNLVQLQKNDTLLAKWRQEQSIKQAGEQAYLWELTGLTELSKNQKSLVMRQFMPFHYEMLFIMVLATCSKYADVRSAAARRQQEKKEQQEQSAQIDQSQAAYLEAIREDGFSSSATDELSLDDNSGSQAPRDKRDEEPQEEVQTDDTLRGRFYRFFQWCYGGIRWFLGKSLNFATIHSTKVAMSVLFCVTALEPNIFNGFLFMMFLAISMGNNSQMLFFWRFTLGLISLLLFAQYSLRVFASNDFLLAVKHRERNNLLCLSGLVKCEDDSTLSQTFSNLEYMNLKLYLPYYALLITFIIGYYILTSEHYQQLMDEFIDQEIMMQRQAKKDGREKPIEESEDQEISLDHDGPERSGLLDQSQSKEEGQESGANPGKQPEGSQNADIRKLLKNAVLLCDPATKYFVQNSLYLLIGSMALLSTTLPLALTNVLLLIVMTILVVRALTTDTQLSLYRSSTCVLYFIKYGALLSIAGRYLAQFYLLYQMNQRIVDQSLTENKETEFYHVSALLFGYTQDFFVVRLLLLSLILIVSNMQLGMLGNQVLMEIIAESDAIKRDRTRPMSLWGQIKAYTVFTLYLLLPVGLLGVIFFLVARSPSFLGLIAMFATVIILQRQSRTFWKESYKTIGVVTQVFVLVTYSLDFFMYVAADRYPWFVAREPDSSYNFLMNSLHSNLEYFNTDQKFFTRIFWLYVILAFCFLQKAVFRYESFFKLQVPEKPVKVVISADEIMQRVGPGTALVPEDQSEQVRADLQEEESYQVQMAIYDHEACIRNCLWFKNEVAMVFGFTHGVSLTMLLCLVVIFVKVNVTSVLYIIALYCIHRVRYYPSRFQSTLDRPELVEQRERVNRALRYLIALSSVLILVEYTLLTIHNFTVEAPQEQSMKLDLISSWESFVRGRFCHLPEDIAEGAPSQCVIDWNNWLQIGRTSISGSFFAAQYFLLLTAYFARHFTAGQGESLEGLKILPEPVYGDESDFTGSWSLGSSSSEQGEEERPRLADKISYYTEKMVDYVAFSLFPYVLLSVIFVSVIRFDGVSFADLIDCGFLMQCFYLLAYIKSFYAKNVQMLSFLRGYNIIVLTILVVYQAPFFLCPVDQPALGQAGEVFYVPAPQCHPQRVKRVSGEAPWLTFYVVMAQSVGLKKYTERGQFPWAYLLIVLFTEVQAALFHHPYFRAYTLQAMRNQKLDGRMRGFMTVENFHLNRKWAYKAIKQQMRILHERLNRYTQEYNQLLYENSFWSTDDYRKDLIDSEETRPLRAQLSERGQDAEQERAGKVSAQLEGLAGPESERVERAIGEIMKDRKFTEMLEDIALQLLKPNLPVISLKQLRNAVKEAIKERHNSFLEFEVGEDGKERLKRVDLEDLRELIYALVGPLQRAVYRDNKIALYNKDGVGLNFALEDGCREHLERGDDAFYYSVFTKRQVPAIDVERPEREARSEPSDRGVERENLDENEGVDHLALSEKRSLSSRSSYSAHIGDGFIVPEHAGRNELIYGKHESELLKDDRAAHADSLELNQDWKETLDVLREKEEEIYQPFMQRVYYGVKRIILEHGTNRLIFYSLYDKKNIVKSNNLLRQVPLLMLLQALFISQAEFIVFALFFINFAQSATLINLVLPLSALLYALLENPMPSYRYWRFVSLFVLVAIAAKLAIQLPVFCSSPAFAVANCDEDARSDSYLVTRIDFLVGLTKFSGPASYPKNIGILPGILWDLLILVMLVNVKSYLVLTGQWHYVRGASDIHCMPRFKSPYNQKTQREKEAEQAEKDLWENHYPSLTFWQKVKFRFARLGGAIADFFFKLQPRYMDRIQPNRDLRTQQQESTVVMNPNKVKPGKDFFSGNLFTLMLIFAYTLLFQKHITGARLADQSRAIDFDHFTVAQVGILLALMIMMMVERMLYRTRKSHNKEALVSYGSSSGSPGERWDWTKHTLTFKLIVYVLLVAWVHIYGGFVMPAKQGIRLSKNPALLANYLLWVCHFVFAGLQLKHGYPQAPYKTTFMRDTSFTTVNLFRLYRAVPFIWEMKVIIDWTVTHTCLDLFQWFRLDDAFNYVYFNKYQSDSRKRRREFEQRHWTEKFCVGFCFAFGIILLILAPILLFSGINPTLVDNPVKSGAIELTFELNSSGNQYQIFQSQAFNIRGLQEDEEQTFDSMYTPLDQEFNMMQMQRVQFTPYSQSNWVISTPSLNRLVQDFETYSRDAKAEFMLKSSWSFTRALPVGKEAAKGDIEVNLPLATIKPFTDLLQSAPTGEEKTASIRVNDLFPKMIRLGAKAETQALEVSARELNGETPTKSVSVDLQLHRAKDGTLYWTFAVAGQEGSPDVTLFVDKQATGFGDDLVLILYNESAMSSALSGVMSMSVIGIYVTIVYAVGRFLRIIFDRYSERVIYEELPETGKLFEICEGIFIAQLEGDMVNEKRLYDLLITVYRSPELMLKMTGVKQQYLQEPAPGSIENGGEAGQAEAPELAIDGAAKAKKD